MSDGTHLIQEGERLDDKVLYSAHGSRRWRARATSSLGLGYARNEHVYELSPLGGDVRGFGGVKRLFRSEHELLKNGWRASS